MSQPWKRQPGETAKAYSAFQQYCGLGSDRSIDKCFAQQSDSKTAARRAARHWFHWSSRWNWVERARAYDEHCEAHRQAELEKRLKQLAHQQADFAVEEFTRLVRRVRLADKILDKADEHPITDIEVETVEGGQVVVRTKTRGISLAGYANLMKEIRESGRRAILGPRDGADENGNVAAPDFIVAGPEGTVVRAITWKTPSGQDHGDQDD